LALVRPSLRHRGVTSHARLLYLGESLLLRPTLSAVPSGLVFQRCSERIEVIRKLGSNPSFGRGSGSKEVLDHAAPCVVLVRYSWEFVASEADSFSLQEFIFEIDCVCSRLQERKTTEKHIWIKNFGDDTVHQVLSLGHVQWHCWIVRMTIRYDLPVAAWPNIIEEVGVAEVKDHVNLQSHSHEQEGHHQVLEQILCVSLSL
jgi:hypothetical protein